MVKEDTSRSSTSSEADLFNIVEQELESYVDLALLSADSNDLTSVWQNRLNNEPQRFIKDGYSLNREALRNLRRMQILVTDNPRNDLNPLNPVNILSGGRRGEKKMLQECLAILQEQGYGELLRKYPCHQAGNPHAFRSKGFSFTLRWFKHICFVGLLNKVLGSRLANEFIGLDIGSSYGIFASLVKREYPKSRHILVDFPEQLILAKYFLASCFPEARIAGVKEVSKHESLSRNFIEDYDFVLVPSSLYDRLTSSSADLVTNFASFGEMTRYWYEYYTKSPAFQTASYLFTVNRIQSYPTYDTDVTILDYPVWDPEKRLHFGISPAFSGYYRYLRRHLFFSDKRGYPPYFEYIGEL